MHIMRVGGVRGAIPVVVKGAEDCSSSLRARSFNSCRYSPPSGANSPVSGTAARTREAVLGPTRSPAPLVRNNEAQRTTGAARKKGCINVRIIGVG